MWLYPSKIHSTNDTFVFLFVATFWEPVTSWSWDLSEGDGKLLSINSFVSTRYIGKQIGRLLVKSGTIVCLDRSDSNSFHDDSMYQWSGRKPSTPNLRNGSPSKLGQSWKLASPSSESPSSARSGAKYTEAEMQQALVRLFFKHFGIFVKASSLARW